jgi:transcriptional regulator with XRE-family HTH domain
MTKSDAMANFAQQLKTIIQDRGMTLSAAAAMAGMDHGNFSKIVNGKENVTLDRAERIANALGVELCIKVREKRKNAVA